MRLDIEKADKKDLDVIKKQLKTDNLFVYGIAARCIYGFPQIAVLNPIENKDKKKLNFTALINPLWLTCPYIHQKIHDIENEGGVEKIQSFIRKDRSFKDMMEDAHAHYYFFRKELYFDIAGEPYSEDLICHFNRGIGGIGDMCNIKCLHVHYAHYRFCNSNIAGLITEQLLNKDIICKNRYCTCLK
jgi:hypothetical protein